MRGDDHARERVHPHGAVVGVGCRVPDRSPGWAGGAGARRLWRPVAVRVHPFGAAVGGSVFPVGRGNAAALPLGGWICAAGGRGPRLVSHARVWRYAAARGRSLRHGHPEGRPGSSRVGPTSRG